MACCLRQTILKLYEYDGGVDKSRPDLVVFPRTTDDVVELVKLASEHDLAIVGRGAGTGLSGGLDRARGRDDDLVFPHESAFWRSISRMNVRWCSRASSIWISRLAVQPFGYFFAPDPSSQSACTIGGNVAENAGGPHTLAHGVTTNHVISLEAVLPDGTVIETAGKNRSRRL